MNGRLLAIGDIHGCDLALEVLLAQLQPGSDDTVVILGDVIDRGPNSRRAVDMLLDLAQNCHLVSLMGNHEEMLCDVLSGDLDVNGWASVGGRAALRSYGDKLSQIPLEHQEFFRKGLPYWETDTEIFVHANLHPMLPLDRQDPDVLRWQHLSGTEQPHISGKRVICGHTSQRSGLPVVMPGWVCIDTYAYGGQFLTALEVGPDQIFQSNQQGEFRCGVTLRDLA